MTAWHSWEVVTKKLNQHESMTTFFFLKPLHSSLAAWTSASMKWFNDKSTKTNASQKKQKKNKYTWAKYKYTADYTINTNVTVEREKKRFCITQCALCAAVLCVVSNVSERYILWTGRVTVTEPRAAFTSCTGLVNWFFCSTVTATGLDESGTCH